MCLGANNPDSGIKREPFLGQAHTTMDNKITGTKEPITFFSLIFDFVSLILFIRWWELEIVLDYYYFHVSKLLIFGTIKE